MFVHKYFISAILLCFFLLANNLSAQDMLPRLKVSENKRFLCDENGEPFFWLGDTAWELFLKLSYEEAAFYFDDRRAKGFNVIQITILSENDYHRIDAKNYYGHKPLINGNPLKPDTVAGNNNDYWDFVDRIIKLAASKQMYVGLLPTWGEYVTSEFRDGVVNSIFNEENAFLYGEYVGKRYKNFTNIVWIFGGDRSACTDDAKKVWRALAKGIAFGVCGEEGYGTTLMTFHPVGKRHSTADFPNEEWIDFNAIQSGHGDNILNWKMIEADYSDFPDKPLIDLESSYPFLSQTSTDPATTDFYARRAAYWSVFSGSFGHTYGHHGIWNFVVEDENKNIVWKNAINASSAAQMGYLKNFIKLFPYNSRIPDQTVVASNPGLDIDHVVATRGDNYVLVYTPINRPIVIRSGSIQNENIIARWFNPRDGSFQRIGIFKNEDVLTFCPPESKQPKYGNDWVLVIEDYISE